MIKEKKMFKADCDICVEHYFIAIIFNKNKRQPNLQPVILKAFKGSAGRTIGLFERGVGRDYARTQKEGE